MAQSYDIDRKADALRVLMRKHLGVGGRDLERVVVRAGRLLPGAIRSELEIILEAQRLRDNPKLQMRLDSARVEAAFRTVSGHLRSIDHADRVRGRWLSVAATIAFNLLFVTGLFILWLWWRDYI